VQNSTPRLVREVQTQGRCERRILPRKTPAVLAPRGILREMKGGPDVREIDRTGRNSGHPPLYGWDDRGIDGSPSIRRSILVGQRWTWTIDRYPSTDRSFPIRARHPLRKEVTSIDQSHHTGP
jgi:hypothetical protein